MSGSRIVKIIIAVIVLALIIGGIVLWEMSKTEEGSEKIATLKDFILFNTDDSGTDVRFPDPEDTGDGNIEPDGQGGDSGKKAPLLLQLHTDPVAGVFAFLKDNGDLYIRYIGRKQGHIYETNMDTLDKDRLSNKTRQKIYEAYWGDSGNSVATRYLDEKDSETIITNSLTLSSYSTSTSTTNTSIEESSSVFLPIDISSVSVKEAGFSDLFYLIDNGDYSIGKTSKFDGSGAIELFSSQITEWLSQWPSEDMITLTTKPSAKVPGYIFSLSPHNGAFSKIFGGINGLTTLVNSGGDLVLYSESNTGGVVSHVYSIENEDLSDIGIKTLPEKCAWSRTEKYTLFCAIPKNIPFGDYPDIWYQGSVSFSDDIWRINVLSGVTKKLIDIKETSREDIDIIKPFISQNEDSFVFVNKKDSTPWIFRLEDSIEEPQIEGEPVVEEAGR